MADPKAAFAALMNKYDPQNNKNTTLPSASGGGAAMRSLDAIKADLDAAQKAEKSALNAANQYVTDNMGWLDMKDPAELQALNDAASAATKRREELEREYYMHSESFEDKMGDYGRLGRAATAIINKPFLAIDTVVQTAKDARSGENKVDMTSLPMLKYGMVTKTRDSVSEGMGKVGAFLTDTGMSIADNLYSRMIGLGSPAATLAIMGTGAAADKMYELGNQGESASRALVRGAISGLVEGGAEALSFQNLLNLMNKGGAKSLVEFLGKQFGFEASEEGVTYVSNYIADKAFKDPNAKFNVWEMLEAMGQGGLSGLFFGAGGYAANRINGGAASGAGPDNTSAAAVEQASKEIAENHENQTTTARIDVPAVTATSEQKTAPNAVNGAEAVNEESTFGQNTVGSAEARFKYREAPTQSVADNLFTEQELQDHNLQSTHQVYADAEAGALADQLLAQDYEGEVARLSDPNEVWDKTANVEGHRILENLTAKARESGSEADWKAVIEWKALYDSKGGTEHAQALQGRAQYADSTANIVAEAAETLEGSDIRKLKPQQKAQLLDEVYTQAEAYNGIAQGDTGSLIALIERNNEIRRTTGLFSQKTAKQMDWALHQVAEKYPDTAEQFLRDVATAQIRNIASDYKKVGVTEAAKSVRIMNMLSKFSTVMRNLVSNNVFDPLESLSNNVGILSDMLMSVATGQRTTTLDKSWLSSEKRSGSIEGALKSYIEVGLDAATEDASSRYEGMGSGRTFKMTGNVLERLLSTWAKYENYALKTTDEFQKGGIRAESQRQIDALKQSGKLDENALDDWAKETARQRTFQNDSVIANTMTKGRDALNSLHIGSVGAGDILLPFARVPGNLAAQSANYSLFGFANSMRQAVEVMIDAKRGNYDSAKQAQAARNFGRGVTGTALLAGFGALAAMGLIDVAGADDEDKEALEKAQGKTGTQWNLTATLRALNGGSAEWQDDDILVSIGFLDPINAIMAAGSLLADDCKENGFTVTGAAKASLGGVWQAILDLPAMTSFSSLINSYEYAEGETDAEKLINAGLDYAGSQAASFFVPNALRGVATGTDDTVRNQYSGETVGESTLDGIKSGIPGLRGTLPAALDPFGREKTQTGNALLNILNNNILPGAVTKYRETTVEKILDDLYSVTGEASIYPDRKAPNSFSAGKEKFTLDSDDKDEFMEIAGSTAEDLMTDLVNSEEFKRAGANEQAAYLSLANEYARAMAKYELTNGKYELSGFAKSAAEASEKGVDPADYLMFYSGKGEYDADKNGRYTNAENIKAIEQSGLSGNQRIALYMITFPSWIEGAEKRNVSFENYVEYKVATNGHTKKADKISALVAAGYTLAEANRMYREME